MFIVLMSSVVFADSVVVLEERISRSYQRPEVSSKFFMDTTTSEGFAKISVVEWDRDLNPGPIGCDQWGRCYPSPNPMPRMRTLLAEQVEIPNLRLENKQMIYTKANGETVNCGRLGTSRVLRVPTLYLSGNCELVNILDYDKLTVIFKTK